MAFSGQSSPVLPVRFEYLLPLASDDNQLDTHLEQSISHHFPPSLLSPLLSDLLSPTYMASPHDEQPYSPSPPPDYGDEQVGISHIQSVPSLHQPHTLPHDPSLHQQPDHLASKPSAVEDDLLKAQQPQHVTEEPQPNLQSNTNASPSANEDELQATAAPFPVQRAIQKAQKRLKRGPYMCKLCRGYGHTAKTCTKRRNPVGLRAMNTCARKDQFLSTLLALEEVSRKTPKEQLYLHYEAILTAVYQLAFYAYRRTTYRRDKALQALQKCLETERVIANCIFCYNEAASRLSTVMSGKENVVNYAGPIKQHPEFFGVMQETKRCLYRALSAMRNADCSIRNILFSSVPYGEDKRQEPLMGMHLNDFVLNQARQGVAPQRAAAHHSQEESACTNARKAPSCVFQPMDKADMLALEDETCNGSTAIDFRGAPHQHLDASFRDIDLFIPDDKE